ncbi:MAG TPA: hypothetical protein VGL66_19310 [Caulobacteraceae bacterium]
MSKSFGPAEKLLGVGVWVGLGLLIWGIVSTVHFVHDLQHPEEKAARIAQEQYEQQQFEEGERQRATLAEWQKGHVARVAQCQGGDAALGLPPDQFQRLNDMCEAEVARNEPPKPYAPPE